MTAGTDRAPLIALVDDQRDVRTTLSRGLAAYGFRFHPLASGGDLIEALDYLCPDAILLDMHMPGLDGVETLKAIENQCRGVPVLFFTSHGDVELAVSAMKLGAADFIEKPSTFAEIATKINAALSAKKKNLDPIYSGSQARALLAKLSSREHEILHMVIEGLSNKEIAEKLNLSSRTVESHRANAIRKIGTGQPVGIVRLFDAANTM